jgi:hypothetical protein
MKYPFEAVSKWTRIKLVSLSVPLTFISYTSLSQTAEKTHKSSIGLKLGYTHSTVRGTEIELETSDGAELRARNGVLIGLVSRTNFLHNLLFQTELTFIGKGGKIINQRTFYEKGNKTVLYLQLPLLFGYRVSSNKKLDFTIEAGPAFHYAVRPYKSNSSTYVGKSFLFCPVAGATWVIKSTSVNYLINARYDFDYQNYYERMSASYLFYIKHTGTFSISAGILL